MKLTARTRSDEMIIESVEPSELFHLSRIHKKNTTMGFRRVAAFWFWNMDRADMNVKSREIVIEKWGKVDEK